MDTSTPQRTNARTRALRRLRTMTIGTALAGVAASAGFGWLAAATDDGGTQPVAAVDSTGTTTTPSTGTTTGTSSSTTSSATVSGTSGSAQVSTGGS
jgi:hypothetical protein